MVQDPHFRECFRHGIQYGRSRIPAQTEPFALAISNIHRALPIYRAVSLCSGTATHHSGLRAQHQADSPPPPMPAAAAAAAAAAASSMDVDSEKVPVTFLCGFLGAGKTTLLKHLVAHETGRGRRIAAIVNDVATLNIDGSLVAHAHAAAGGVRSDADAGGPGLTMVTLEGGSICSKLQDDLAEQLVAVAKAGAFDHIFVECSGVTHPVGIVSMFKSGAAVADGLRLHATVTMVDCFNLCRVLLKPGRVGGTVEDAWQSVRAEWDDSVTNLYIEQIEWCARALASVLRAAEAC